MGWSCIVRKNTTNAIWVDYALFGGCQIWLNMPLSNKTYLVQKNNEKCCKKSKKGHKKYQIRKKNEKNEKNWKKSRL